MDDPPAARHHLPQRQAGDRRRRAVLAGPDHRPEGSEDRRGLDLLHGPQAFAEARRPHGADPAEVRERRLPRRPRPVLQLDRPHRLRPGEAGRHRAVHVRQLRPRRAQRVQEVPRLLARRHAARGRGRDHRLPRRHAARQRAAERPGRRDHEPAAGADRAGQVQRPVQGADLGDGRLAAVHDARRPGALQGRPRAPGDAPARRPRADDRAGALRPGPRGERPLLAVRPGLQQRPASAQAGPRPGQVAPDSRRGRAICASSS